MRTGLGDASVSGPSSIALAELADSRVLGLVSVGANRTLYRTLSADSGGAWSALVPTEMWSVEPQILSLPNGAVLVSAGRPSLSLWVSVDIDAARFTRHGIAARHSVLVHSGLWRFSTASRVASGADFIVFPAESSGQTSLQLIQCTSSIYWEGIKCMVAVSRAVVAEIWVAFFQECQQ